jgi:hypothetical protein
MEPFVILGASKTGTSTAVAVANAHPSVFCLFEADFSRPPDHARNADLACLLAEARSPFQSGKSFATCLVEIGAELATRGWRYAYIGTKVQGIRPDLLPCLGEVPVLFMVRDVRRWAVKNRILRDVIGARTATNIVPYLVSYARYFLDSFRVPSCIRVRLDDVLSTDTAVFPRAMAALLGLPQSHFESWWTAAATWKTTAPKSYSDWIDGHTSAFLPPLLNDTVSQLAKHPLWDAFLPVFDKYFQAPDQTFALAEIARDQQQLDEISTRFTMRLEEGFNRFESFKIMGLSKRDDGKLKIDATDRVTQADLEEAATRWRLPES